MADPAAVLRALSDPTRVAIMELVTADGSATATQLAARFPMSRQAVTRHLKTLEDAQLLVGSKLGREHVYHANLQPMGVAASWLDERSASWSRALGRLEHFLSDEE